jgi:hypothetical protein
MIMLSTSTSEWTQLDDDEIAMMDRSETTTATTVGGGGGGGGSKTQTIVEDDDRHQYEQKDRLLPMIPPPPEKTKNNTTETTTTTTTTPVMVEIQGLSLLDERDDTLREIKQANQAMFFHALQLIKKQKHWLTMLRDDSTTSIEQRTKALNDLEILITDASTNDRSMTSTFAGQKALFKAMALLDDSMATFERRYKIDDDHYDNDDNDDDDDDGDDNQDYDFDHNIPEDLLSYDCSLFTSSGTVLKETQGPGQAGGLTIIKDKGGMRDVPSLLGGDPFAADADSWANEVEQRMMMCSDNGDFEEDFSIAEDLTLARIEI